MSVTVAGAHGTTLTLPFGPQNGPLAAQLAGVISAGVENGSIFAYESFGGPIPNPPPGETGEFIVTTPQIAKLPAAYTAVVMDASSATILGGGGANESVLAGLGNLTFFGDGGSGTIVTSDGTGDGNNLIVLNGNASGMGGDWQVNTGFGNDTIAALTGNDTINAGGGNNSILLGSGNDLVNSQGNDTIVGGSGNATVGVTGMHDVVVSGGSGNLTFLNGAGNATVQGGTGSATIVGGQGGGVFQGGSGGNNLIYGGAGATTIFGGGNGDSLFAGSGPDQVVYAGSGNETLSAVFDANGAMMTAGNGNDQVTGGVGNDTLVAGTGNETVTGGLGADQFQFDNGDAGGKATITDFSAAQGDRVALLGYNPNQVQEALAHEQISGGNTTITLADNTTITFIGVTNLNASDFVTGGNPGGGCGTGHGNGLGHGMGNGGHDNGLGNGGQDNGFGHG